MRAIGEAVSRFQDGSAEYDEVAAEILGVERPDLPCMTVLLFGGPSSVDDLAAAVRRRRGSLVATIERLQIAGYVRVAAGGAGRRELSEHARTWIERIWTPLQEEGRRLLGRYSTRDLALMAAFMDKVCARAGSR